jgi:arylamine N-acetyltransferase
MVALSRTATVAERPEAAVRKCRFVLTDRPATQFRHSLRCAANTRRSPAALFYEHAHPELVGDSDEFVESDGTAQLSNAPENREIAAHVQQDTSNSEAVPSNGVRVGT